MRSSMESTQSIHSKQDNMFHCKVQSPLQSRHCNHDIEDVLSDRLRKIYYNLTKPSTVTIDQLLHKLPIQFL